MRFASRDDAGLRLGRGLKEIGVQADLVLGLPRGGVVVAAAVARTLQLPLGAQIVRKIGHPLQREFAVGAVAEPGVVVLDEAGRSGFSIVRHELEQVIREETERLRCYQEKFHPQGPPVVNGKTVIMVDDGLATGATCEAGVLSVRHYGARRVIVAAPVASTGGADRLARVADQVSILWIDPRFEAVGSYYQEFEQTTDEEVVRLLGVGPGT